MPSETASSTTPAHPGRTVLVTGCSSGIGRATALAFHERGWHVVASARRSSAVSDLADAGLATVALDVSDERSMQAAVAGVAARHGTVGVLVNNAGYGLQATVEEATMDEVRAQFETNVFGLVRMCQLVLPGMRSQGWGRIVNVGSMGGRFTFPGGAFYHASKHAVESLSDALRLETASFGIGVSVIEPGPVRTQFGATAVSTLHGLDGDGPYADFRRRLAQRYASTYSGRRAGLASPPEAVARVIVRAAATERPKPRYVVGPVAHLLVNARRLLPDRAFDALLRSQFPTP